MRVLIVEDELLIAMAFSAELRAAGHEVVGVATGEAEAVECFGRERPEIAVLDIRLSQGNGLSVAKRLGSIPVLFVTSDGRELTDDLSPRTSAVMLKPFEPERIVEAVDAVGEVAAGRAAPEKIPRGFRFLGEAASFACTH